MGEAQGARRRFALIGHAPVADQRSLGKGLRLGFSPVSSDWLGGQNRLRGCVSKPHQIHDENRFLMMIACEGFGATQWECLDRSFHFGAPIFLFYPAADRLGCVQWPRCLAVLHIVLSGNPGELKSVSALGNSYDDTQTRQLSIASVWKCASVQYAVRRVRSRDVARCKTHIIFRLTSQSASANSLFRTTAHTYR